MFIDFVYDDHMNIEWINGQIFLGQNRHTSKYKPKSVKIPRKQQCKTSALTAK